MELPFGALRSGQGLYGGALKGAGGGKTDENPVMRGVFCWVGGVKPPPF